MRYEPKAAGRNVVTCGDARFTFLTSRMVRLEWAKGGEFEDRATFAVVNRRLPAVKFTRREARGRIVLKTSHLCLTYRPDGLAFSPANLRLEFAAGSRRGAWRPGQKDPLNLPGTGRTLDCADGDRVLTDGKRRKLAICPGLISRSGWAVYDDSGSVVRTADGWVAQRPAAHRLDWYFLGHGLAYKDALAEAATVFGRQPVPPRYTLGLWWSRYWAYTEEELRGLVGEFDRHGVPLDVLVIDMDWHKEGWTGYSWDRRYFPEPAKFLAWLKRRGLKITLNLHPADGVGPHEDGYERVARAMGADPARKARIPFDCASQRFMDAYFKHLHHPLEKAGVDFWWMDWQQGRGSTMPGLDPLPWLNITHWEDQERRGKQPLNFSRYGGVGSGRYPIGFSGDTFVTWRSLAYQPQFTASAANVLFGQWSHDIGGHMGGEFSPELYLRWIQFGVHSPILRIHTTKNLRNERRFWEMPSPYSRHMMDAVRRRYELAPYLYTEHHSNVAAGLSLCRPLYHEWPQEPQAYRRPGQYLFGREMMAAPVVAPADPHTHLAETEIYLPPGQWFDTARGAAERGGRVIRRTYMLGETPLFVRAGAVIPGLGGEPMRLPAGGGEHLLLTVYPGRAGEYEMHEDGGGEGSVRVKFSQRTRGRRTAISVGKARGTYDGFSPRRSLDIRLPGAPPPAAVKVNGRTVAYAAELSGAGWTYDGATATAIVRIPALDLRRGVRVEVTGSDGASAAQGWAAVMRRLGWISLMAQRDPTPDKRPLADYDRAAPHLAHAGRRISYDPACFAAETAATRKELQTLGRRLTRLGTSLRATNVYPWWTTGPEKADGLDACVQMLKIMKREKLF